MTWSPPTKLDRIDEVFTPGWWGDIYWRQWKTWYAKEREDDLWIDLGGEA